MQTAEEEKHQRECRMVAGSQGQITLFANETTEAVRELVPEAGGHCWVSEPKSSQRVNNKRSMADSQGRLAG